MLMQQERARKQTEPELMQADLLARGTLKTDGPQQAEVCLHEKKWARGHRSGSSLLRSPGQENVLHEGLRGQSEPRL